MHAKTMEGLVGARMNMNMSRIPMRIYKEAERRGDIGGMERAVKYVGGYMESAKDYQKKAEEGMKEDAEEAKEKRKQENIKTAEKYRKESGKLGRDWKEAEKERMDTVEISQKGKELSAEMEGKSSVGRMEGKADAVDSGMR